MRTSTLLLALASSVASYAASSKTSTHASSASASATAAAATEPGYFTNFSTVTNNTFNFGQHYAVLNLDLINGLVGGVANTTAGKAWINSTATWIDAVHAQDPLPLSIFSRIYFSNARRPEIGPQTPFGKTAAGFGAIVENSTASQIYPAFHVNYASDVVVQKTRYYAGFGNQLEEVLRSQLIDTVILSGIRTSGVILSSVYHLFDLNYKVYVIADNSIETPSNVPGIDRAIKEGIIPKLPADVITLEQALAALKRSGPAIY